MTNAPSPVNLAPHSVDAEEAVLGSILINPDALYDVAGFLRTNDFFVVKNAWVFEAINTVSSRGDGIDNLTVIQELRAHSESGGNRLESIGGSAYIAYLINNTPTHVHAETYARIVERAAIRRRLLAGASEIAQLALEENAEIDSVVDQAREIVYGVTANTKRALSIREIVSRNYDSVERMYKDEGKTLGLPTGFSELDRMWSGLEKSRVYIVAARPGMGKTSLLLNVAANVIKLPGGKRVGIFTLEMNEDQLVMRLQSMETGINSKKLRLGNLDYAEWKLFTEASGRIAGWSMDINADNPITIPQMRAQMRNWQREGGLDLVIVDYLQLVHAVDKRAMREAQVAEVARGLKELARAFNVPILAAAQLNREVEGRQDKRPKLADLRESGEIENAADVVAFVYRDEVYDEYTTVPHTAEIITAKNRDGELGSVMLGFLGATTKFTNVKLQNIDVRV